MKLEIIKGKKPLTSHDVTEASQFIGKECYFSDDLDNFDYLDEFKGKLIVDGDYSNMYKGKLLGIFANDNAFIVDKDDIGFRFDYCLPAEWVVERKKPKYRPYTLAEWIEQHEIGEVIHYRSKSGEVELRHMYVGTRHSQGIKKIIVKITLGDVSHTLDYLFEDYEIEINGEWKPFGIEVEE